MVSKIKKAIIMGGIAAISTGTPAKTPAKNNAESIKKEVQISDTRQIVGNFIAKRESDVYIINSENKYMMWYLDTDKDGLEDTILTQIIGPNILQTDFFPGTPLKITEKKIDNRWIIQKIEIDKKSRTIKPVEFSR
ncbi:MAG: hypothetical protein E7011_03100 [Alphaproteobacteria bacterium]|nr:hypothetical protein [Alphaproteobacteria bacterium]